MVKVIKVMPDIDAALASFGLALLWAAIIILVGAWVAFIGHVWANRP